jgi:predicted ATPase/DNA-binding XRE family transcriptional regulator
MVVTSSRTFGDQLRRYRVERGLTQEGLAEHAGLSTRAISDLERGIKLHPRRDTIHLLSMALKLDVPARALLEDLARRAPRGQGQHRPVLEAVGPEDIPNNLPALLTPLIGREREIDEVRSLLLHPNVRLLTVTGPGGIGKTRLALQAAQDLIGAFENGVFLVRLASVTEPGLLVPTIAQTLRVPERAGQPLIDGLRDFLRPKAMLLVLDNFEHLVKASTVVVELLEDCPEVKVLVTSREVLHLVGERPYSVPPLALPNLQHLPSVEQLRQCDAVELFVQRARMVKPDFALTAENAPLVARVCHRLDGLPLAIELVTARLKIASLTELLSWLDRRVPAHVSDARDAGHRQQTIRNTFAWSYDLLNPGEQTLFRRLAVFVGGWNLPAANAVCNASQDLDVDLFDGVASLVDKSLLNREESPDGTSRFAMLEVIRDFAFERLVGSGEADHDRAHHATFFLELAERAEPLLRGKEQDAWLRRLDEEHDNFRAALQHFQATGAVEAGLRLCGALQWFWWERGFLGEGQGWCESFLGLAGAGNFPAARAKALNGAGYLATGRGDFARAIALCEESLAISRDLADQGGVAWSLVYLAAAHHRRGDPETAKARAAESLAAFRASANEAGVLFALCFLGLAAQDQGDDTRATAALGEAAEIARRSGDREHLARALTGLGLCALFNRGDVEAARAFFREGLSHSAHLRQSYTLLYGLEGLAAVAALRDEMERAVRLWEASAMAREASTLVAAPQIRAKMGRYVERAYGALPEARLAQARDEGRAMTLYQVAAHSMSSESA